MNKIGTLYLVATPIGNLEDITLRALRVLKEVDLIAAEDTRHTLKLLNHFDIKNTLISYHEHNKIEKGHQLVNQLLEGKNIALVTDAGSPGISDPGEELVRFAVEQEIAVTMVPGATALIAGLVLSGLPAGRFSFEGFLSTNKKVRNERLQYLKEDTRTLVFYEAPHKLKQTLRDLREAFGNRRIALAREMTKKFEEIVRCTLDEAIYKYNNEAPRGEYVLTIDGADEKCLAEAKKLSWNQTSLKDHVEKYINSGLDRKDALKRVADERGMSRRDVYNSLIKK